MWAAIRSTFLSSLIRQQSWRWRGVLITVPLAVLSLGGLRYGGLLETLELAALDQLFLLRPSEPPDDRIVLVTIDEADIQSVGTWPMSDATLAQLLRNIRQQNPHIIGLDLYRNLPVAPGEAELQQILEAATTQPKIMGVQKIVDSEDSAAVAPQPILGAANQAWANDFAPEPDGSTRRVPVYLSLPEQPSIFSFSFVLACQYLEHIENKYCLQEGEPRPKEVQTVTVNGVPLPRLLAHSGGYQRDDTGGYFLPINYRGPKAFSRGDVHCRRHDVPARPQTFQAICMEDVLANQMPEGVDLRDRIVIIGPTAQSLNDLFETPYSHRIMSSGQERMPGLVVHANATSQLLAAALDGRPLLKTWSVLSEELWIVLWACLGAGLSWQRGYLDSRQRQGQRSNRWRGRLLLEIIGLMGVLGLGSYTAFLWGWWIPLLPALLALGGTAIAVNAYIARTATEIRKIFGRYVTDQVVATLLENPEGLKIGGDRRRVTLLTSDLRGFTATSEQLPPEEVVEILNLYLSRMTDVIEAYGGTIDGFIGDGILVLFGAPTETEDDAARAVACAVAMQCAMADVNRAVKALNENIQLEMGIGLNTGEVVVGNIGSEKHTQYSVIGNHVNLAFRIEGFTVGGQILVSASTRQAVGEAIALGECTKVEAKGIREPITVCEVLGMGKPFNLHLPQSEEKFAPLSPPVNVEYILLDEKRIESNIDVGQLTAISPQSAWLLVQKQTDVDPRGTSPLTKLDNLKISLTQPDAMAWGNDDLYAKVIRCETHGTEQQHCLIRFTACSATIDHWINHYQALGHANTQSSPAKPSQTNPSIQN